MLYTGLPIPKELVVMHTCDNPVCVNPNHLQVGTQAQNNKDMGDKGRSPHGEDHWRSCLTKEQVLEIIKDERVQRKIAADYDINQQQVSRIKTRKHWKHLH